jgi:hypothetical protein
MWSVISFEGLPKKAVCSRKRREKKEKKGEAQVTTIARIIFLLHPISSKP